VFVTIGRSEPNFDCAHTIYWEIYSTTFRENSLDIYKLRYGQILQNQYAYFLQLINAKEVTADEFIYRSRV
jgi:hypothetical protein